MKLVEAYTRVTEAQHWAPAPAVAGSITLCGQPVYRLVSEDELGSYYTCTSCANKAVRARLAASPMNTYVYIVMADGQTIRGTIHNVDVENILSQLREIYGSTVVIIAIDRVSV